MYVQINTICSTKTANEIHKLKKFYTSTSPQGATYTWLTKNPHPLSQISFALTHIQLLKNTDDGVNFFLS